MATITETVRRPQVQQTQCFIGGKWVPSASGKTFETIQPGDRRSHLPGGRRATRQMSTRRSTRPARRSTTARGRRWTPAIAAR